MRHNLFILFFTAVLFLFCITPAVSAQQENSFKVLYDARYQLHLNGDADVDFDVVITNLRSDVYVREFSLAFPSHYSMSTPTAEDDFGTVIPTVENTQTSNKITFAFSRPATGKNSLNRIRLHFLQKNLFKTAGIIWEMILPTVSQKTNTTYNIRIMLPEDDSHTLSIAKPKPTHIENSTISWENLKERTVYAVFGSFQYYDLNIRYTLKNDELRPVYYDIALPPETSYQSVFINSLKPEPEKVYFDEDGNVLARYTLSVAQQKKITFKGGVKVFAAAQKDFDTVPKNYLLETVKYWNIGDRADNDTIAPLKTPEDIYRYVTKTLTYNYDRINEDAPRLGALAALDKPDQAVCTEFTDVFIAIARKKGIYSREIEGYGFSDDQTLRPLSTVPDILHAWPEYYDGGRKQWIPVDPTWENTSGIDYFSSFDVNHIVFAIHGKDPVVPAPAGSYKVSDTSKDIDIAPSQNIPLSQTTIQLNQNFRTEIVDNTSYKATITIKNTGNVFVKNALVALHSDKFTISPQKTTIALFAPYQTQTVLLMYKADAVPKKTNADIRIMFNNHTIKTIPFVISPFFQDLLYKGIGIGAGLLLFIAGWATVARFIRHA